MQMQIHLNRLSKTLSMCDRPLPDFPYFILVSWSVAGVVLENYIKFTIEVGLKHTY